MKRKKISMTERYILINHFSLKKKYFFYDFI